MADERPYHRHRRENLLLLYRACEIAAGKPPGRGGQLLMSRISDASYHYLSDLRRSIRFMGDDVARRIEQKFNLEEDWMDHAHPASDAEKLSRLVPLPPDVQKKSTPAKPPQPRTALEKYLLEELEQVKARLAQAQNNPK